ncbi:hypothetical protein DTO96_102189 [Ephemeroptericola cinctiostellae]|uniref:Uncharacterized protein n=1 Tax=Ephemeroptericola cinctiostellae TaxID=2268024 RepID=A0A345DDJ7_9BURK|nr:hypothetical protein DTO96_102189 [Ephemeroptericola cinctiostellae]
MNDLLQFLLQISGMFDFIFFTIVMVATPFLPVIFFLVFLIHLANKSDGDD